METASRRKFLKTSIKALGAVAFGASFEQIMGCAALAPMGPEPNVTYPKLKGNKIQPPDQGCLIGFQGMDSNFYRQKIGKGPAVQVVNYELGLSLDWPRYKVEEIVSEGSIPFVYNTPQAEIIYWGIHTLVGRPEFEKSVTTLADAIVNNGKPIFFCTMPEMNGNWNKWKGPDNIKTVWKYMWNIFNDRGANNYATWVWEVFCPTGPTDPNIINPEVYYIGDEYIDWIGLSAFARTGMRSTDTSFENLIGPTYSRIRNNHPTKPIMMAEFGKTNDGWQHSWLEKAFRTMKNWSGFKAATFWNNVHYGLKDNHLLSDDSYKFYKELLKDPYFIFGS